MPYLTESPPLSEHVFALLGNLIEERLGLHYDPVRREIVQDRLAPLVAEHNLGTFVDYYYLLKYDENNAAEWRRVQTALAVRETYFWREVDQIQLAARKLVPALQEQNPGCWIRIWHAACASGEEPYSMAIALHEAGCFDRGPIELIATDFDQESLRMAREAVYRERATRILPPELRQKYFREHINGTSRLSEKASYRVKFSYLNLVDRAAMALMQDFDIVFCRNVFIYFSDATVRTVADHFYRSLRSPGYLFLGAAESLLRVQTRFQLNEIAKCYVYCKNESGTE
jgi:chemotaxis protein methyltransferase CheR